MKSRFSKTNECSFRYRYKNRCVCDINKYKVIAPVYMQRWWVVDQLGVFLCRKLMGWRETSHGCDKLKGILRSIK